jgi:hypothetical protein
MFSQLQAICLGVAVTVAGAAADESANTTDKKTERIGIYDSRAVAFAEFWTAAHQKQLSAMVADAKSAKSAGDAKKADELAEKCRQEQKKLHRQVFSTAPIDEVMLSINDRLPEIQKKAGVSELISKWDAENMKKHEAAEKIDLTDQLIAEFKPNEKQLKMIESIKKAKPVTLEQADKCP